MAAKKSLRAYSPSDGEARAACSAAWRASPRSRKQCAISAASSACGEVADEVGVTAGLGGLESALGRSERSVAAAGVPGAGEGAGFHGQELGGQRGCGLSCKPAAGGPGEVGGLGDVAEEGGLVAHGGHDAAREPPVCGGLGQAQGLDEVALGQAVQAAVVGRPRGQQASFGDGGKQLAADVFGVPAREQPGGVAVQVVDQGPAGVGAAEPVVQLGEQR